MSYPSARPVTPATRPAAASAVRRAHPAVRTDARRPRPAGPSKLPLYLAVAVAALGCWSTWPASARCSRSTRRTSRLRPDRRFGQHHADRHHRSRRRRARRRPARRRRPAAQAGKSYTWVAVLSVLALLIVLSQIVGLPGRVHRLGAVPVIVFSVLQAIAAVAALLLDAGVITAPAPQARSTTSSPYGQYGAPGQYYGQPQGQPAAHGPPAPAGPAAAARRLPAAAVRRLPERPVDRWLRRRSPVPAGRSVASQPGQQAGSTERPADAAHRVPRLRSAAGIARLPADAVVRNAATTAAGCAAIRSATVIISSGAHTTFARREIVRGATQLVDNRPVGTRQARDLLRVAFGPSVIALVVIAAVVLVQLLIANSDMTGAFGAIASMWLGVHQVPVSIGGRELGVMPLLPRAADGVGDRAHHGGGDRGRARRGSSSGGSWPRRSAARC